MDLFGIKILLLAIVVILCFCNFYIYFYLFKISNFMKLSNKNKDNLVEEFKYIWSYTEVIIFHDSIKIPAIIFTILSVLGSLGILLLIVTL